MTHTVDEKHIINFVWPNSDRTACTNKFSSNSDGWHLAMQACFSLHIPQSGPLVMWFLHETEESIKMPKNAYFEQHF